MATRRVEYAFTKEGTVKRDITETPLNITDELIATVAATVPHKVPNVFEIPKWGLVDLTTTTGTVHYYTVNIAKIPMTTRFRLIKDEGVLVPNFSSDTDPVMQMEWQVGVVPDMRLQIQVHVANGRSINAYMFARDKKGNCFKLPLANVFDDCRLCLGEYDTYGENHQQIVAKMLEQFEKAQWQRDLWSAPEKTHRFFRWKPLEKKGFEVLPPVLNGSPWTSLCDKVSIATTQYL